jgi:hypothetical protein
MVVVLPELMQMMCEHGGIRADAPLRVPTDAWGFINSTAGM